MLHHLFSGNLPLKSEAGSTPAFVRHNATLGGTPTVPSWTDGSTDQRGGHMKRNPKKPTGLNSEISNLLHLVPFLSLKQ